MNKSIVLLNVLIIWNLITLILMRVDKTRAVKGYYRISERTLFLCAFFLGGLGIFCGMHMFRHKTLNTKFVVLIPIALLLNAFFIYFLFQLVSGIGITHYTVKSSDIPSEFNNFKILQISDLHYANYGDKQDILINKVKAQKADIIVLTGDMMDENTGGIEAVNHLLDGIIGIAPIYSVSGNHEKWHSDFLEFQKLLESKKVILLENKSEMLFKNGVSINISGISDPDIWSYAESEQHLDENMSTLKSALSDRYNILLFHRANMFDNIKGKGYQLVLSGHLHGGQIQLPLIGGLRSPHGDWFPKYAQGKYSADGTTMIVSRGLGNSVRIPRLFNPPQLVVVTLKN